MSTARDLEELSLRAWPAMHTEVYDGWLLRFSGGYTKRANSVTPLDQGRLDVAGKVDRCEEAYRSRGLIPTFRLPSFAHDAERLGEVLSRRGYRRLDPTSVQAVAVPDAEPDGEVTEEPHLAAWVELHDHLEGTRSDPATHLSILGAIEGHAVPLRLGDVACGLAVVEHGHVGIYDVAVDPSRRRQGLGRRVVRTALAAGATRGAHTAYLSVTRANAPALGLYASFGFTERYGYEYHVAG